MLDDLRIGTHMTSWLWGHGYGDWPLCVSRRRLSPPNRPRGKTPYRPAVRDWMLDSGGFTELQTYGDWQITPTEYVTLVRRYRDEIGRLDSVAPMDHMCEPQIIEGGWWRGSKRVAPNSPGALWFHGTHRPVPEHHKLTVENLLDLRTLDASLPIFPTLQGYRKDEYLRCWDLYERHGIHLEDEPIVGLGSVCRREATGEANDIVRSLAPLRLHGFGVKLNGLLRFGHRLTRADSMAWSAWGRRQPLKSCTHQNCANCPAFAAWWREYLLGQVNDPARWIPGDLFDADEDWALS